MNIFPAMQAHMGRWTYYVVRMSMRELAQGVKFGHDVYEDPTLSRAVQRELNKSRAVGEIARYLYRQQDRFFSSIVVAAIKGNPKWYPVTMEADERFELFKDDDRLSDTFGVLRFDGTQDYYALDGQHRLFAIQALLDPNEDIHANCPEGFKDEEISVIVVVAEEAETEEDFLIRYRRLFGNLNRYAKPMSKFNSIVMDEDDAIAIITRQLVTEHEFFQAPGREAESERIRMAPGKNVPASTNYVTTLECLYAMNTSLLSSSTRANAGWSGDGESLTSFIQFRPDEETIDGLYTELKMYWDALIEELPLLNSAPVNMRQASAPRVSELEDPEDPQDCALFRPVCQELMCDLARALLNFRPRDPDNPTRQSVRTALKGMGELVWDGHSAPWRHLVFIPTNEEATSWRIASEDRRPRLVLAQRILRWQLALDELADDEIEVLKEDWRLMLLGSLSKSDVEALWAEIEDGCIR